MSPIRRVLTLSLVPLMALAACGDDDSTADDDTDTVEDTGAVEDTVDENADPTDDESSDDSNTDDGGELVVLSSQEICDLVTTDIVGEALGVAIDGVEPSTSGTQQCAYRYGGGSNVTVASLSADEVGGASGDAAFERVLDINRGFGAGNEIDEAEVAGGDRAYRMSGESLHLGIVASGGHLLTLIVPVGDFDTDAADALIAAVGDAVA